MPLIMAWLTGDFKLVWKLYVCGSVTSLQMQLDSSLLSVQSRVPSQRSEEATH